jgi:threonine dehydratase
MIPTPGIDEIRAAAERIRRYVRQTPLLAAVPTKERPELSRGLRLKLEALQVTGSFKARGAINALFAALRTDCAAASSPRRAAITGSLLRTPVGRPRCQRRFSYRAP